MPNHTPEPKPPQPPSDQTYREAIALTACKTTHGRAREKSAGPTIKLRSLLTDSNGQRRIAATSLSEDANVGTTLLGLLVVDTSRY